VGRNNRGSVLTHGQTAPSPGREGRRQGEEPSREDRGREGTGWEDLGTTDSEDGGFTLFQSGLERARLSAIMFGFLEEGKAVPSCAFDRRQRFGSRVRAVCE